MQDTAPQEPSRTAEKPTAPTTKELSDQELDFVSGGGGAPPAPHGPVGQGG
jgi:hypothetical protein